MSKVLCVDIGSYETRYGVNDSDQPSDTFQTVFNDRYPIIRGKSMQVNDYEKIFQKIFNTVGDGSKYRLCLAEPTLFPTMIKEKVSKMLFEKFDVMGINWTNHCILNMFAYGDTTGLPLDGYGNSKTLKKMNIAGMDVDKEFLLALKERSINLTSFEEKEFIKKTKEKECFVALDFKKEVQTYKEEEHCKSDITLPDGQTIDIGIEKFRAPELVFNTSHLDIPNIHENVAVSIKQSPMDIRKNMWSTIILSGGTAKVKGFIPRLKRELLKVCPKSSNLKIEVHEQKYPEFNGCTVLSELNSFKKECMSKKLYEDAGIKQIHKLRRIKFF